MRRKIRFAAIKENICFEGKQDIQTKVMIALFGLFAEVKRDLISQRTKEGLAAARAKGRLLGRPKGSLGKCKLDGKEGEIRMLLEKDGLQGVDRQDRGRVDAPLSTTSSGPESSLQRLSKGTSKRRAEAPSLKDIFACAVERRGSSVGASPARQLGRSSR